MLKARTFATVRFIGLFLAGPAFCQTLEDNFNDLLHYTVIGRLDLAKGYAQAIVESKPDPVALLELSMGNPQGYSLLLKVKETAPDAELAALAGKVLDIIEQGRFIRRSDPKIIVEQIKRLSGTSRGRLAAIKRLQNAGEYAIMYMLDALGDPSRAGERPNIVWALSRIGKNSIRPLVAALQGRDVTLKSEVIKALGKIGYPQSLPYLRYIVENDGSAEMRDLAKAAIKAIDASATRIPAAQLFYRLAESYYYHAESLAPAQDANFANMWFWDGSDKRLVRKEVDKRYFNELMAMRCCEWSLKADAGFGQAIGLWLAAFFKAESAGVPMPEYFGAGHADAMTYATTAGPEYLHQALARAVKDKDAYVALGVVEALATTAGESSLFYRIGTTQPLTAALSFDSRAVRYSAAIAIAEAGPNQKFPESRLVVEILADALGQTAEQPGDQTGLWNAKMADSYALRAARAMLQLGQTRNPVLDLSIARDALIAGTKDKRTEIQMLTGRVLAYLDSPDAQQAIAAMALDENNDANIRISAFTSLAVSAKINACLLDDAAIDAIYSLVGSKDSDAKLRSAAAAAYGALNLPSEKVKNLILDQARS